MKMLPLFAWFCFLITAEAATEKENLGNMELAMVKVKEGMAFLEGLPAVPSQSDQWKGTQMLIDGTQLARKVDKEYLTAIDAEMSTMFDEFINGYTAYAIGLRTDKPRLQRMGVEMIRKWDVY